jgi:hypothetical protein
MFGINLVNSGRKDGQKEKKKKEIGRERAK